MPRATDLAQRRHRRQRAALIAERERQSMGFTLRDTRLIRADVSRRRDGHRMGARPLACAVSDEPAPRDVGALRGHAISDPSIAASTHLLRSQHRNDDAGWLTARLLSDAAHDRASDSYVLDSGGARAEPLVPVREAAEELWSTSLRNSVPAAEILHKPPAPKMLPPSWAPSAPTFGGGVLVAGPAQPAAAPSATTTSLDERGLNLKTADLTAVAGAWKPSQVASTDSTRTGLPLRKPARRRRRRVPEGEFVPRAERPKMVEMVVDKRVWTNMEQCRWKKRPLTLGELLKQIKEDKFLLEKHGDVSTPATE